MYQTRDNDLRLPVTLDGYKMQLTMGSHARRRVHQRSRDEAGAVFYRIALLLENEAVGSYLVNHVKIGDPCVIFDADTGFSYPLAIGETEITVMTVFRPDRSTQVQRVGQDEFCMFVKQAEVVCADVFRNIRLMVDNLTMENSRPAMA